MPEKDEPPAAKPPPPDKPSRPAAATAEKRKTKSTTRPKNDKLPPYNVVLLNDEDHTYEYVIEMLGKLFGHDVAKAYQMAREVDATGRAIVLTTHKEKAELKRDQVHAYGADVRMETSKGSMTAVIEPAE